MTPGDVPHSRYRVLAGGPGGVRSGTLEEAMAAIAKPSDPGTIWWIDIVRPGPDDAALLRDRLGFHPLTVEDCLHGLQTPKIERYPGYFFLVFYAARINAERKRPAFYELHCFVGANYLVTVRHSSVREVRELMARWRSAPSQFGSVGHLAHGLADAIVDSYFPMVDHFSVRVGDTETESYADPNRGMQQIMNLRRELLRFRGVVGPTRDVLSSLLRRDLPFLEPDLLPYYQDVRDHAVRVTEEIDLLRDLLSAAVEAQFAVTSTQLNRTVRMMTAWSIILMSMTLIAGVYGMNFAYMPELSWRLGYPVALLVMVGAGGALLYYFRRRRWL